MRNLVVINIFRMCLILLLIGANGTGILLANKESSKKAESAFPDIYIAEAKVVPKIGTKLKPGEKSFLTCDVRRNGKVENFHVGFKLDGRLIKEVRVRKVNFKSGKITVKAGFKLDPKVRTYTCIADSRNKIRESDETNNRKETTAVIIPEVQVVEITNVTHLQVKGDLRPVFLHVVKLTSPDIYRIECYFNYSLPPLTERWDAKLRIYYPGLWLNPTISVNSLSKENGVVKFDIGADDRDMLDIWHNKLECILDSSNTIDELDESNNRIVFDKNNNRLPMNLIDFNVFHLVHGPVKPDIKAERMDFQPLKKMSDIMTSSIPAGDFFCKWSYSGEITPRPWKVSMWVAGRSLGVKTISVGETRVKSGQVKFHFAGLNGSSKDVKVKCVVDSANDIGESNEINNRMERPLKNLN